MKIRLRFLAAACAMFASVAANAQNYPDKPITIVVPFGPGSGTDVMTRIIAQPLGVALNQNIVVETKPGANGAIAATYVAHAAPDGYTLFMSTNSPHAAALSLNKSVSYDPVKDFAAITRTGSYTIMLAVDGRLPIKSVAELVAYAKANPNKLSYGSGNTAGIVAGALFKQWAGIDIVHVPYKTVPNAITDVLGGQIPIIFTDLSPGLPHFASGAMRPLACTRLQRSALLPNVPTFAELGATNFEVDAWAALFAPAGTPPDIINRLNTEMRKILADPKVKEQVAKVGFEPISSTPAELDAFVKVQLVKWTQMIKSAGIQAQ
jgi:tripartite-type tricarboxylate transporter receptor subunit TctC